MTSENPYESASTTDATSEEQAKQVSSGHAVYNVVSDTLVGVNVRKSDNKFQGICIAVSVLLLATIGVVAVLLNSDWNLPWYGGAIIGGFAGLIFGLFASGIFLMIYRAVRHLKGQHE